MPNSFCNAHIVGNSSITVLNNILPTDKLIVSEAYEYNGYDPDVKTKGRLRTLLASDYKTKYHIIKHPALPVTGFSIVYFHGDNFATLNWDESLWLYCDRYIITGMTSNDGKVTDIIIEDKTITSYLIEDLIFGDLYHFYIRTRDSVNNRESNNVEVQQLILPDYPIAVSDVTFSVSDETINLQWLEDGITYLDKVRLYVNSILFSTIDAGVKTVNITGLTNNVNYNIKMVSVDRFGQVGDSTDIFTIKPLPAPPLAVSGLTGEVVSKTISVSWNESTDTYFGKYVVYSNGTILQDNIPKNQTSLTKVMPNFDTDYSISIRAFDIYGQSGVISNPVTIRTWTNIPSNMTSFTGIKNPTTGFMELSWVYPTGNSHIIEAELTCNPAVGDFMFPKVLNKNILNYTATLMTPGVLYNVTIKTIDDYGQKSTGTTIQVQL